MLPDEKEKRIASTADVVFPYPAELLSTAASA
jgi:hypothetical protein